MNIGQSFVELDGSLGEGGGQVLRSALSLSIMRGQPLYIQNIRANRSNPGLRPQHLAAVDAAAAIGKAEVEGAELNSRSLTFIPSAIRTGRYKFDIGTAGATTLVLQTIFLPLSNASSASTIIIRGGTHVPWSPCYHYLEMNWLPMLKQIGYNAKLTFDLAGFYPRGGGRISATIRPVDVVGSLRLLDRGELIRITGISAVSNLKLSIADRQKRQAMSRLQSLYWKHGKVDINIKSLTLPSQNKGTFLILKAEFEGGQSSYFGLGELGKPAEKVADEAVDSLMEFINSEGAIDEYLADQLLIPLCFGNNSSALRTSKITSHLLTNAIVARHFLPIEIEIQGEQNQPGTIHIRPS